MSAFDEVTGAILIGGKSRRLGRDKVLLPFHGRPLAVHMYEFLDGLFPRTILIGHPRPELESAEITCIPDLVPDMGVLGGLYTALCQTSTEYVFVTGADMPFLTPSLISEILHHRHNADAVIPRGPKGMEPLCAVYSRSCTNAIKESLDAGVLKIMAALDGVKVLTPKIIPAPGEPDPFININYPEDWEKLKDSV